MGGISNSSKNESRVKSAVLITLWSEREEFSSDEGEREKREKRMCKKILKPKGL